VLGISVALIFSRRADASISIVAANALASSSAGGNRRAVRRPADRPAVDRADHLKPDRELLKGCRRQLKTREPDTRRAREQLAGLWTASGDSALNACVAATRCAAQPEV
jgi:hypothetical protein